jgi:streptogramin lyase
MTAEGSVAAGKAEGSVAAGYGAVWVASFGDGRLLRVDPKSQTVTKPIPLGTLIYPASLDAIAVGEGAVWLAVTSYAS